MSTLILQIRERLPLAPFVAQYSGGVKQSGRGWFVAVTCPFCTGHKKLWIDGRPGRQVCNCFKPTCAAFRPMDVINFYARLKGLDNRRAIEELAREVGLWEESNTRVYHTQGRA